jgi:hypothetical protein
MTDDLASAGEPDHFPIGFPRRRAVKSRSKIGAPIDTPARRHIPPK